MARQNVTDTRYGPFETAADAIRAVPPARDLTAAHRRILTLALARGGVELGAYDERILAWLAGCDTPTAVTIAGWITRAGAQ